MGDPTPPTPVPPPLPVLTGARPGDEGLLDEGPCLFYYRLSYRRRFLRTLYFAPLNVAFLILPMRPPWSEWRLVLFVLAMVGSAVQAGIEYRRWQQRKRAQEAAQAGPC